MLKITIPKEKSLPMAHCQIWDKNFYKNKTGDNNNKNTDPRYM